MAISRTVYTQGKVTIEDDNNAEAWASAISGVGGYVMSGVQSANYTTNSPKQDVNSFGTKGTVNKVQVEPTASTLEVSAIPVNFAGAGLILKDLVADANRAVPSGCVVSVAGVGMCSGAILSSFRLEGAIGSLPSLNLTFEGKVGQEVAAEAVPSVVSALTIPVATPFSGIEIYWNDATPLSGCPQTVRAAWEMPVDRVNCLMGDVNTPTIFSRPPGTFTMTIEGVDETLTSAAEDNYAVGLAIYPYTVSGTNMRVISQGASLAVGDAGGNYTVTVEGTASAVTVDEKTS